uniref:Sorting nexin 19 n=1 Tax=Cyclopterus lumpus TaxID=8103 RepID=A0A8C3A5N5_CYCLU
MPGSRHTDCGGGSGGQPTVAEVIAPRQESSWSLAWLWLDVSVANLTSSAYWVAYLQVIQESVWPGGALPTAPRLERSRQQKDDTRRQALSCLMRLLPDLISDLLGSDKYKLCWQTALGSLQDPHINRHLVFCIFDLLLEFLVPEIPEEDFQRSLLRSLSKNPEKQLA